MNRLVYIGDIMERAKAYVQPADLAAALKFFKEKTGFDATRAEVNPKIAAVLDSAVPEGLEVVPVGGVLSWEIWLSSNHMREKETVAPQPTVTPPEKAYDVNPVVTKPLLKRRQPAQHSMIQTRDERIVELAGSGSYRKIATSMKMEGYKVSHMTVARRLREKTG